MIKLVNILGIKNDDFKNYKIHFAIGEKDKKSPYNSFIIGKFDDYQKYQTKRNFQRDYVISLIYYEKNIWLFAGVYKVLSNPKAINIDNWNGYLYDLQLLDIQTDLIGRMFVYYKKDCRASYLNLERECEDVISPKDMYVSHILDKRVSINDFNGFDSININYATLKYIIDNNIQSWKSALSKVKGIYLIVDTLSGKQYVGSAYGNDCIWQRWSSYAHNGHGGNKELKNLLTSNEDYKYNFKYSILEICNMNLGNDYIISRENYWKEVLMTRDFGLNDN